MHLFNRELSWLSFNERVLQESLDTSVPIIERVRFLGIYSNNMDEFYRVRVATVRRMLLLKKPKIQGFDSSVEELLNEIQSTVKKQRRVFDLSYAKLLKELEKENIFHINEEELSVEHKAILSNYFFNDLQHDIVPLMLTSSREFPRLVDKGIYLAVKMKRNKSNKVKYALIQIPASHDRFKTLKGLKGDNYLILLDDIIRLHLNDIFSIFQYDKIEAHTFKFTRDAELDMDDDLSVSMLEKMRKGIKQRKRGAAVRFIYHEEMPTDMLNYLLKAFNVKKGENVIPSGRYHNFKDFMKFPDFGRKDFRFDPKPPVNHPSFEGKRSLIKAIFEKDVLLHYPYQRFDYIVDLLRESAIDPKVRSIKINIYRVAKKSQVINALINALKNGKEVVVVVELQARFDEENNMYWSKQLKDAGAKLILGVPGFKVHSKLIQIERKSSDGVKLISHVGTGNFHEATARIYGDYGLLTANEEISNEVLKVFNILESNIERNLFRQIMVSPFNTRRKFIDLINVEIKNAKKGLPAKIYIKLNNLVDQKLINKLYAASKAGVKIKVIIRGICALKPGVPKLSENIQAISIVDRFLEHARTFIFHNNGNEECYISSADWMERNLDKRIEVTVPILDADIKAEIKQAFKMQWKDNQKARIVDAEQKNKYKKPVEGEEPFRSQYALYDFYEKKAAKINETLELSTK